MIKLPNKKKKFNSNFFWKKYEEIFRTKKQGLYKKAVANVSDYFLKKRIYILK